MRLTALCLLALSACATDIADAQLPPPTNTQLYTGSVVLGEGMDVIVEGANPFDTIQVYGSVRGLGPGPCPPQFGGTCLGIRGGQLITDVVADATGRAEGVVRVPMGLTADDVALQAISGGWINSYTSNPVERIVQDTPPLELQGLTRPPEEAYTLEDMRIEGDTLFVDVTYSGGCVDHEFLAQWGGFFAESIPEQVSLNLLQLPSNDPCDAIVGEELRIDLKPIREAAATRPILVNLGGLQRTFEFL